jgi:hypothetical protein
MESVQVVHPAGSAGHGVMPGPVVRFVLGWVAIGQVIVGRVISGERVVWNRLAALDRLVDLLLALGHANADIVDEAADRAEQVTG